MFRPCTKCGSREFRWKLVDDEPGLHVYRRSCRYCHTEVGPYKIISHHPPARSKRLRKLTEEMKAIGELLDVTEVVLVKFIIMIGLLAVLGIATWAKLGW